jgi:hypothetical protein
VTTSVSVEQAGVSKQWHEEVNLGGNWCPWRTATDESPRGCRGHVESGRAATR